MEKTYLTEGPCDAVRLGEAVRQSGESIAVACTSTGARGIPPPEQLKAIPGDEVVKSLQEKLPEIKLQIPNHSNLEEEIDKFSRKLLNSFFQDFSQYHSEQLSQIRNLMELKIKPKIREVLGENLSQNHSENTRDLSPNSPPQQSLTNPESQQPNHSSNFGGIVPFQPEEIQSKTSQQQPEQLNRQASENSPMETTVDAPWEYNSLPQNEPAPHSKFDFKAQETPDKPEFFHRECPNLVAI